MREKCLAFILAPQMILILNVLKVCQVHAFTRKYDSILSLSLQNYAEKTLILKQQLHYIQSYHTNPQDTSFVQVMKSIYTHQRRHLSRKSLQIHNNPCFKNQCSQPLQKINTKHTGFYCLKRTTLLSRYVLENQKLPSSRLQAFFILLFILLKICPSLAL